MVAMSLGGAIVAVIAGQTSRMIVWRGHNNTRRKKIPASANFKIPPGAGRVGGGGDGTATVMIAADKYDRRQVCRRRFDKNAAYSVSI